MRKNKLLLLLVLLMTAVTGAWAQDAKHLITATYREQTRSLEQPLPYATTIGELYEAVTGEPFSNLISSMSAVEMPLTGISSNNTSVVSIGELNGASTPVTVNADGKATISINFGSYAHGIFVSATSPLYAYMKDGVKDADKWTVKVGDGEAKTLPVGELSEGNAVTLNYKGRLKVKNVTATTDAKPVWDGDLSKLTDESTAEFATATDGMTITGTLAANVKISIADGATVTLKDVNITKLGNVCNWAGINCPGDATLVLEGTNEVCAGRGGDYGSSLYPGIWIAPNKTLTIQGAGNLTAYSGGPYPDYPYGAGIGGGFRIPCGNIVINSGNITATGGDDAAGIGAGGGTVSGTVSCGNITINGGTVEATGSGGGAGIGGGYGNACGNITISGGTVSATGGYYAAGIGGGRSNGACGTINIKSTVTSVTATKGSVAPNSIGSGGENGTAITVTIGGEEGAITDSPYTYEPTAQAKPAATVTTAPKGAEIVGVGKNTALVSGGAADGGTLWYAVTTTNTKPTSTDGFSEAVPTAQAITASGKVYVWYYVKGDDTHTDSEIAATAIEVPVADIVWDATNVSDLYVSGTYASYTKEGVKLSGNADQIRAMCYAYGDPTYDGISFDAMESGGYTFTAPTDKAFTKIVMKPRGQGGWDFANLGTGWTFNQYFNEETEEPIFTVTWTGSAASTVDLLKDAGNFNGEYVKYIAFYLSE